MIELRTATQRSRLDLRPEAASMKALSAPPIASLMTSLMTSLLTSLLTSLSAPPTECPFIRWGRLCPPRARPTRLRRRPDAARAQACSSRRRASEIRRDCGSARRAGAAPAPPLRR